MHITKIELENIKSYESALFEFERGTTAIVGENGAGKTTIIEAVAWVLFDLLDYKKDDFLRRGTKRGSVKIEFESGLDERRYIVQRDTRTAYFVFDTKLGTRIADKKEEVTRFLWQHLGVEPGTDLESLFRRAIGVPQGTFTAIFLETAAERKKAFDKLLKVEEYRIGAFKLGQTAKYVQTSLFDVEKAIARAEGELSNRKARSEELKKYEKASRSQKKQSEKLGKELSKIQTALLKLEQGKAMFETLKATVDALASEQKNLILLKEQAVRELAQAKRSAEVISRTAEDHKTHQNALGILKELERERIERDRLNREIADLEKAIATVNAEKKAVSAKLNEVDKISEKLKLLRPQAKKQKELETEKASIESEAAGLKEDKSRLKGLSKELVGLRERLKQNRAQIDKIAVSKPDAEKLPGLLTREKELTAEIAALSARVERDREFKAQVRNGECPIFSAQCLNLKEGQTLDGFLDDKFSGSDEVKRRLETEQASISNVLKQSRAAEKLVSGLSILEKRNAEILGDGKRLREEHDLYEKRTAKLPELEKALLRIESELKELRDPVSSIRHFENQISEVQSLQLKSTDIESNLERLNNDRGIKLGQLDLYKDLDARFKTNSANRDRTSEANIEYIKSEKIAKALPEIEKRNKETESEFVAISKSIKDSQKELESAEKHFDPAQFLETQKNVRELQIEQTRTDTEFEHTTARIKQLQEELEKLQAKEKEVEKDQKEKERLGKLLETVTFIRNTLKSAAPRVAQNYVYHVSVEANTLYREITGNAEATLRWTDDYGIALEEGGYERPFISLSGGEQMSAALSVRLALLKQLSDVKLAFFDEPTTNMDHERRERLAEQISRITENRTFDQLFVISHDDTFESYADHLLSIGD